jgi:molecular chaperone DnaK
MGGLMTTIINRNSSIPVKQSEVFSTGADSQDSVEIHVLQGERPFAKDNKSLGIFKLTGIPLAPKGIPRINVTFQLDVNGLLSVSAREEQTGQEQSIRIEGASTLSREDIASMLKEAEENSISDKTKKVVTNILYELDNLFFKIDILNKLNLNLNSELKEYITLFNKELQLLSKQNNFKMLVKKLNSAKIIFNLLLFNFLEQQIKN